MTSCSIDGCLREAKARTWCKMHWVRWKRHGNPKGGKPPRGLPMTFIRNALSTSSDKCLSWPFAQAGNGYGKVFFDGHWTFAHRVVCRLAHGLAPTSGHHAAHSCGNGHLGCVNPHHLSWKTPAENNADKNRHGTTNAGSANGMAKISVDDVRVIRSLKGQATNIAIAKQFGVSPSTINDIHNGRRWSSVQ